MTLLSLSLQERAALETAAARTKHAPQRRRAQALLWLDEGETVPAVAARLRLGRQAIYKGITPFQTRATLDIVARISPGIRSGRPRTVHGVIDPLITEVIERDPRDLGYRSTVWPAPLLTQYLREWHHRTVSRQSVSLTIARLGLRWKRPRHDRARRPATWRQAKGGSSAVLRHGSAPSS